MGCGHFSQVSIRSHKTSSVLTSYSFQGQLTTQALASYSSSFFTFLPCLIYLKKKKNREEKKKKPIRNQYKITLTLKSLVENLKTIFFFCKATSV